MKRKAVIIITSATALLAALACSPKEEGTAETVSNDAVGIGRGEPAVDGNAKPSPDDYVVYVDKLNLRNSAGSGDVVAVLTAGTYVEGPLGKGVEDGGYYWVPVRAGGKEGWLADKFIIPAPVYEATRKADELGRSGDAAAMVAEIKRVTAQYGKAEEVSASPNGKKLLCRLLADPADGTIGTDLYFVAGRGLVEKLGESLAFLDVKWSADGRYYARGGNVVAMYPLHIYDTDKDGVIFDGESYLDNFEFVDGYFVFLTTEPSDVVKDAHLPAMYYVTLPDVEMSKVLEAEANDARGDGPREYRLRPVGEAPEAVAGSALYREYKNSFAPSYVSEA